MRPFPLRLPAVRPSRRPVARRAGWPALARAIAPIELLESRRLLSAASGVVRYDADGTGTLGASETGTVGGFTVYLDQNYNGIVDAGEASRVTAADGAYAFDGLAAGTYNVRLLTRSGWTHTAGITRSVPLADDQSAATGVDFLVTDRSSVWGHVRTDADAKANTVPDDRGVLPGVTVFADLDQDGAADPGEPTAVSDATGRYHIGGLPPSSSPYLIRPGPVDGQRVYAPFAGVRELFTGGTAHTPFRAGEQDFTFTPRSAVGGRVYLDQNRSGTPDAGEPGQSGWTAYLDLDKDGVYEKDAGEPIATVFGDGQTPGTSRNFGYRFEGLQPGEYRVGLLSRAGYELTTPASVTVTVGAAELRNGGDFGVVNVAPPAVTGPAAGVSTSEGQTVAVPLGSFADHPADGPWTVTVDFGDGTAPLVRTAGAAGSLGSAAHTYADDGNYTARVTVTDPRGASGSVAVPVAVANVAPTVSVAAPATVAEGAIYTLSLSAGSDPGADAISSWTIHWGDGSPAQVVAGNPASVTHVYDDGHIGYSIAATATDEDGTYPAAVTGATVGGTGYDPTFNGTGFNVTNFGNDSEYFYDVLVQPDGKVVAIGDGYVGDWQIARYNANGSPDASFGTGGKVVTPIGAANGWDRAYGGALQPDGKLVVVGQASSSSGAGEDWAIARYNTNGSLDATFGNGGKLQIDVAGSNDRLYDVVVLPDGKILVAGLAYSAAAAGGGGAFALARFNPNGTPDASFGASGTGRVTTDFGPGYDFAEGLAIQPDGRIVAAGAVDGGSTAGGGFGLARYSADGVLDATFGTGGKVVTTFAKPAAARDVALMPDGRIVAAGSYWWNVADNSDFAAARYTADGALDASFGTGGKTLVDYSGGDDEAYCMLLQADGRLIIGGAAGSDGGLVRLNVDGTPDVSFGTGNGRFTMPGAPGAVFAIAASPGGKLVLAGDTTYDAYVARVTVPNRTSVTVTNVAPTAALSEPAGGAVEGRAVELTGSATDVSRADTAVGFTYAWTVTRAGSAAPVASGTGPAVRFTPGDDGEYLVSLTARDRDGGTSAAATRTVWVGNAAPTAALSEPAAAAHEGELVELTGSATDPSSVDAAAGLALAWTVTRAGAAGTFASGTGAAVRFTPDDNGEYVVGLIATDKDGAASLAATRTVQVANRAPTVAVGVPTAPPVEGAAVELPASAADPSAADTAAGVKIYWHVRNSAGAQVAAGDGPAVRFTPTDDGWYYVDVQSQDKDGALSEFAYGSVLVANRAPTATFAGATVPENTAATVRFAGQADAPADLADGLLYSYDLNNDGTFEVAGSTSPTATVPAGLLPDGPATRTVRGRVADRDGGFTDYTAVVTVTNAPPAVRVTGPTEGRRNKAVTFTFAAADPSAADAAAGFRYSVDWNGNGVVDQVLTGGASVTASYKYAAAGTYRLTVYATDRNGGQSVPVVYPVVIR